MGAWEKGSYTTLVDWVDKFATFLSSNGWTLDFNDYTDGYRRVHTHFGAMHFDMYVASTSQINFYACTGYDAGEDWNGQPASKGIAASSTLNSGTYYFVATASSIYFSLIINYSSQTGNVKWGGFGLLTNKIGNWDGGQWLQIGNLSASLFTTSAYSSSNSHPHAIILVDGEMYGNSGLAENCMTGSFGSVALFSDGVPMDCNQGLLPIPILVFLVAEDTEFRKPVAYVDDLFSISSSYLPNEEILTIGGSDYIVMTTYVLDTLTPNTPMYMFKIS